MNVADVIGAFHNATLVLNLSDFCLFLYIFHVSYSSVLRVGVTFLLNLISLVFFHYYLFTN